MRLRARPGTSLDQDVPRAMPLPLHGLQEAGDGAQEAPAAAAELVGHQQPAHALHPGLSPGDAAPASPCRNGSRIEQTAGFKPRFSLPRQSGGFRQRDTVMWLRHIGMILAVAWPLGGLVVYSLSSAASRADQWQQVSPQSRDDLGNSPDAQGRPDDEPDQPPVD